MPAKPSALRHLPPSAVPVRAADLQAGIRPPGDAVDRFRAALAAYLQVSQEAIQAAASGRTGLYCLLHGLKLENSSRKQVVMPAYTCPAVARVVSDLGLQPVFVDLSPETMAFLPQALHAAVSNKTLAVIHVHPFGIPLPIDDVLAAAHDVGAVVIEDAAQALGAMWNRKAVGTSGDYGLYSLGPGKPLSTGGGGIVIAKQQEGVQLLERWWAILPDASKATSAAAWVRQAAFQLAFHPSVWWAATRLGAHRVGNRESSWGYQIKGLSASQAGVGLRLLSRLDEINAGRRHIAKQLRKVIAGSTRVHTLAVAEGAEPFFLRFPLVVENHELREELYKAFWSAGIGAGRLYEKTLPSLYPQESKSDYRGAEVIAQQLLTLPTHHYVREKDIDLITGILQPFT